MWLTRGEAAELVGLGPRQFSDVIVPRLAEGGRRGRGKSLRYHGPAVVAAHVAREIERAAPAGDPDDGEIESAWLEEKRKWDARFARKRYLEYAGDLVRMAAMKDALTDAAKVFAAGTRQLEKQFGADAAEVMNDAVGEWRDAVMDNLAHLQGPLEDDDTGDEVPR